MPRPVPLQALQRHPRATLHLRHGLVTHLAVPRAAVVAAALHRGAAPERAASESFLGLDEPERLLRALDIPGVPHP